MKKGEIFNLIKEGLVFNIFPEDFADRPMAKDEMLAIFNHFDAFWQYDGNPNPQRPHALLKSGLHSNGFISCKEVLQTPSICVLFANEIVKKIQETVSFGKIDVVVSSAYSAISLGWEVARLIKNQQIEYIPVEKDQEGNPTIIRGGIDPEKKVLVINELMTTSGGSTWETKKAVLSCNGENPPPQVIEPTFVLIHRSKDFVLSDSSGVFPIFHFDIENFEPENCPYCAIGSKAIKPKIGNNWNLLHGK